MDVQAKIDHAMRFFQADNPELKERVEAGIERNRKGWGKVTVKAVNGAPIPGAKVEVRQRTHAFRFGCNIFKLGCYKDPEIAAKYEARFKQVFNQAVVPFFWNTLEPEPGQLRFGADSAFIDRRPPSDLVLDWCEKNGVEPKGHCLLWHLLRPDWLPQDAKEQERLVRQRFEQIAERYGKRIRIWDVVNEALVVPKSGANAVMIDDYIYRAFRLADRLFPMETELVYNDVTGTSWADYHHCATPLALLAENLQLRGARLGGLGLQFHLWYDSGKLGQEAQHYLNPAALFQIMDRYAALRVPLHVSEISLSTAPDLPREAGMELQRLQLEHLYRLWFSHEATGSIVYWNLPEKAAFVNPKSTWDENQWNVGLVDEFMNPKPSYETLDRLVNTEWKTSARTEANAEGRAYWKGFYGEYDVTVTHPGGVGTRVVSLSKTSPNEFEIVL